MLRIANLELMSEYGADAFKLSNAVLASMHDVAQRQLIDLKRQIQDINYQRRAEQMDTGARLQTLEDAWVGLVSKNYEIECACLELEREAATLGMRKSKRMRVSSVEGEEEGGQGEQSEAAAATAAAASEQGADESSPME